MERLPWVERKFQFNIPPGWLPNIINRLEGAPLRLAHYVNQIGEGDAEKRFNDKWSFKEEVGHLGDLEELHIGRVQDFRERKETLRAADMTNAATEAANHNRQPLDILLENFSSKRQELILILRQLDDETQEFSAIHPRLKEKMRPVDLAFFTAEHDDHHLCSMQQIISRLAW